RVPAKALRDVRKALGVATRGDLRSPDYWQALFGISWREFDRLLYALGVKWSSRSRKLPRGAVTKLRSEARSRGIDPLTGQVQTRAYDSHAPQDHTLFTWTPLGRERDIRYLSEEEVLAIHY